MATLYLHIGTHKTGTTAIQKFCDENRDALARKGFYFPLSPHKFKRISVTLNGHFLWDPPIRPDGSFENPRDGVAWHRRLRRVTRLFKRYPNVLLSDEMLWLSTSFECRGMWKRLKEEADAQGFDVRVIVYFRRQDQFFSHLWAQRVKAHTTEHGKLTWEEALASADSWVEMDYYRHLEEIAAIFGRDAIIARLYDRKRFPDGNIIPDFLNALGLRMSDEFKLPEGDRNLSLEGNSLEIKRIANTMPNLNFKQLTRVRRAAEANFLEERKLVRFSMFTDEELRAFMARFEESNRKLSRVYLGGGDESPFPPLEPQPTKWEPQNPWVYETYSNFLRLYFGYRPESRWAWFRRFLRRNFQRLRQLIQRA